MNILAFFKKKPSIKVYKYKVALQSKWWECKERIWKTFHKILYWKTKWEIVQQIKNTDELKWCKICEMQIE